MMKYLSNKRQSHRKKGQSSKSESRDFESQTAEEKIINSIKLQKELIDTIRFQPWNIHKKLKYLRKAKAYVKGHESSLSRRQDFQRMGFDVISMFIPWEMQIKRVEGHFGSVVASYFLFLRWLLWVNTILTLLTVAFIILPQVIAGEKQAIPANEVAKAGDLDTLIAAEGIVKYSVLFYGFYQDTATRSGYEIPVAYLLTGLATYLLSIIIVLHNQNCKVVANDHDACNFRLATNARLNKTATKDEMFSFSWKLFSSWDYLVGNPDTANNKYAAIITTFKESIREVEEKEKVEKKKLLIFLRCLGVIFSLLLYGLSGYLTYYIVTTSENNPDIEKSYFEANATTWVITVIFLVFPNFFDLITRMEQYHPRTNLRAQLARSNANTRDEKKFSLRHQMCESQRFRTFQISKRSKNFYTKGSSARHILTSIDCQPKSQAVSGNSSSSKDGAATTRNTSVQSSQNCTQGLKCWENYVGQEVIKLTELDLAMTIILILIQDFLRGLWVRFCNKCWCWNLEKTFPEYPEFKTAENILHLINNQGMIWLGWFFSPGLCLMNLVKLIILAYIRFWSVLVCNVPEKRIFRASRSNNFYYVLLLFMLLICCIPPMLAVFNSHSHDCGPFRSQEDVMDVLEKQSAFFAFIMKYAKNPATSFILLGALSMIIYYLWSISRSLKENNAELKNTLDYERTEGKKKVYAMADARRAQTGESSNVTEGSGRETTPGKEITVDRETLEATPNEKCDSDATKLTKIKRTSKNVLISGNVERKQAFTPGDTKRKQRWAPKGKSPAPLVLSPTSASTLVSPTARSPTARAKTLNPPTANTKMGSSIISKKPPSLPSVLNKKVNHGRGFSSKYTSMLHADREAQRLKYETHLDEIKLAKLKKFQLNREIRHVENEILQWTVNSSDEIPTEDGQFDSSLHHSLQQRNNRSESNGSITEMAVNAVASSSSESNFGRTANSGTRRPTDRLRKRSRAMLTKRKPVGYSGGSSNRPKSHVDHQFESNIDQHKSHVDQTRPEIDPARSYFEQAESYSDQAGSNIDQSESYIDQNRSDIDMTKSYFHKPGSNSDQSKFIIDQNRSEIDPMRSYFDQPRSYIGKPGSNTSHPESYIDQPSSYIDQPGSYIDQPSSYIDQPRSHILQDGANVDHNGPFGDWSGSFLGGRKDAEGYEQGGGGGEYVGNDSYLSNSYQVPTKFGFTNFAFDRNGKEED
ncbi:transmembrane channel-like protein 3 [Octopus bimaculoides]|nr:transmembrane channel-like protein 3 [Octopus bimaculoides]